MSKIDKILRKVAKQNGVELEEVKREIEKAIEDCYVQPNIHAQSIPRNDVIPTIDEFILYIAEQVNSNK